MSFDDPIEINGKKYIMIEVVEPPPVHEKLAWLMYVSETNGRYGPEAEDFAKFVYNGATKDDMRLAKAHLKENRHKWTRQFFEARRAEQASA